jgi:hypothetical protein
MIPVVTGWQKLPAVSDLLAMTSATMFFR